jgi:hypothetical protein
MGSGDFIGSFGTAHEDGDPLIAFADDSRYFTGPNQNSKIPNHQSSILHAASKCTAALTVSRPSRSTSTRQKVLAASRPAGSSPRSRKFSNHSKTSRNPVRSRSDKPRNSARSDLQHQRVLMALMGNPLGNGETQVNPKVFY